jgi:ribosomal protein S18 acetylase RimI-like enzyme
MLCTPVTRNDLPRLRELFAEANDTRYDLVRVAEEKCFGLGVSGEPVATIFGDFLGCAVTCGKYLRLLAVHRAHRRQGIATQLVRDAYRRGARVVGAEGGNYFTPGVPLSIDYFAKRGRKTAETQNLIAITPLPARGERVREAGVRGATRDKVLAFIEKNFGKTWHFEANNAEALHYLEHDGEIAGFAAHSANNKGLGFFGPTGVAKHLRGRGYGRELLLASLADMRARGYEQAIIPWTDALEFYKKSCGATIHERFATFTIEDVANVAGPHSSQ